ncbi:hypothetical protein [Vibrio metschnikovii]|uniref:hypothetical protein n=1 Tax=Vibrio metschnikovii TaxID=28172 RepID=UPI001C30C901|nr:hypothetical protein [Vibrio metschnikovii]
MQIKFKDDFLKKQYKKLAGAYRAQSIALVACHFTNISLRYGGAFAVELSQFIQKVERQKLKQFSDDLVIEINPNTFFAFECRTISKKPYQLFRAIERNNKKVRKQEEAPEALAVDGAESSLELCDSCKNTFKNDHDVCPDCALMG